MNTEEKVVSIIQGISDSMPQNYDGVNLINEGVLDSLTLMQLVGELCDEFDIEIDVDDVTAKNFETVSQIVGLVNRYQA